MRKLKLQMQSTVDSFIAGPAGEMDWVSFNWDEELISRITEITNSMDCIVLGRKLAEGFIPHWAGVAADPNNPEYEAGKKFTDTPKVVFSKTLEKSEWKNTVLAKGDIVEEVKKLKAQEGKDIIAYGGETFVHSLLEAGLIDELHLFINPIAIGEGMSIFKGLTSRVPLKLVSAKAYSCGIAELCYAPQ